MHRLRSFGHVPVYRDERGSSQCDPITLGATKMVDGTRFRDRRLLDSELFVHRDVMAAQAMAVHLKMELTDRKLPLARTRPKIELQD